MRYIVNAQVIGFNGDKIILSPSHSHILEWQGRKFLALLPSKIDSDNGVLIKVSGEFTASLSKKLKNMASLVSGIVASRRNVEIVLMNKYELKLDSFEIVSMKFAED